MQKHKKYNFLRFCPGRVGLPYISQTSTTNYWPTLNNQSWLRYHSHKLVWDYFAWRCNYSGSEDSSVYLHHTTVSKCTKILYLSIRSCVWLPLLIRNNHCRLAYLIRQQHNCTDVFLSSFAFTSLFFSPYSLKIWVSEDHSRVTPSVSRLFLFQWEMM